MKSTAAGEPAGAGTILVLYYADRGPLRGAIADHLYSFRRYSGRPCLYLNVAARRIPRWIGRLGVDLVVFHTILLAQRWEPATFRRVISRLDPIRDLEATRIALPQDEFIQTDLLCRFLTDFSVSRVFTCAAQTEWPTIYGPLVDRPVEFTRVLTGYLEPSTVARIGRLALDVPRRTTDVSYRAWRPEAWLGRHGQLKGLVAERVAEEAARCGLSADISLEDADTLLGDDWYRFLLRSRWTVGVEGGASLIDRDGAIRSRTQAFTAEHPAARFEEIERECFPGLDGSLDLRAISPRHLEACATRTGQVLIEGEYNGVLQAGVHYLALRQDFSNLAEVGTALSDEGLRRRLTESAFHDVVASGDFQYSSFVRMAAGEAPVHPRLRGGVGTRMLLSYERRLDLPSWWWVAMRNRLKKGVRAVLGSLRLLETAKRIRRLASRG